MNLVLMVVQLVLMEKILEITLLVMPLEPLQLRKLGIQFQLMRE